MNGADKPSLESFDACFFPPTRYKKRKISKQHMSGKTCSSHQWVWWVFSLPQSSLMMLFCGCPDTNSHLEKILAPQVFQVTRNSCSGWPCDPLQCARWFEICSETSPKKWRNAYIFDWPKVWHTFFTTNGQRRSEWIHKYKVAEALRIFGVSL